MIFGTKEGTAFIFPGTGTGGWEVALANTLSPGDKIVTFRYGQFSHLWVDMMKRLGLDVSPPELSLPVAQTRVFKITLDRQRLKSAITNE
jgi:aspartate aminotransferase-like enzyme